MSEIELTPFEDPGTTTVYLDTSFFAWLRKATDADAASVIATLSTMRVRHVVSDVLLLELGQYRGADDAHRKLLDRIDALAEPLLLNPQLSWDMLRVEGEKRRALADFLRAQDDASTHTSVLSLGAERMTRDEATTLALSRGAPADALAEGPSHPYLQESVADALAIMEACRVQVAGLLAEEDPETARALDGLFSDAAALFSGSLAPEQVLENVRTILETPLVAAATRAQAVQGAVTGNDRRVIDFAFDPDASPRELANALRDAAHMTKFIEHQDAIDFLHVDRGRMNQIVANTRHPVRARGLEWRCFIASGLADVPRKIEMMQRRKRAALSR